MPRRSDSFARPSLESLETRDVPSANPLSSSQAQVRLEIDGLLDARQWAAVEPRLDSLSLSDAAPITDAVLEDIASRLGSLQLLSPRSIEESQAILSLDLLEDRLAVRDAEQDERLSALTGARDAIAAGNADPALSALHSLEDDATTDTARTRLADAIGAVEAQRTGLGDAFTQARTASEALAVTQQGVAAFGNRTWGRPDAQGNPTGIAVNPGLYSYASTVSPDGKWMASPSAAGQVSLYDLRTGQLVRVLTTGGLTLQAAFSPDGTRIAACSFDSQARVWDLATGQQLLCTDLPNIGTSVAWVDNQTLTFGICEREGVLLNLQNGSKTTLHTDSDMGVYDGLAVSGAAKTAYLTDVRTNVRQTLGTLAGDIYSRAAGKGWVAVGTSAGEVGIWNTATKQRFTITTGGGAVGSLSISADGTEIFATLNDRRVLRLSRQSNDTWTQETVRTMTRTSFGPTIAPDGSALLLSVGDKDAQLTVVPLTRPTAGPMSAQVAAAQAANTAAQSRKNELVQSLQGKIDAVASSLTLEASVWESPVQTPVNDAPMPEPEPESRDSVSDDPERLAALSLSPATALALAEDAGTALVQLDAIGARLSARAVVLARITPNRTEDAEAVVALRTAFAALADDVGAMREAARIVSAATGVGEQDDGGFLVSDLTEGLQLNEEQQWAVADLAGLNSLLERCTTALGETVQSALERLGAVTGDAVMRQTALDLGMLGGSATLQAYRSGRATAVEMTTPGSQTLAQLGRLEAGGAIAAAALGPQLTWEQSFANNADAYARHPMLGRMLFHVSGASAWDRQRGISYPLPQTLTVTGEGAVTGRERSGDGALFVTFDQPGYVQGLSLTRVGQGEGSLLILITADGRAIRRSIGDGGMIPVGETLKEIQIHAGQGEGIALNAIDGRASAPAPAAVTLGADALEIAGGSGVIDLSGSLTAVTGVSGIARGLSAEEKITVTAMRGERVIGSVTAAADGSFSIGDAQGITSVLLRGGSGTLVVSDLRATGTGEGAPTQAESASPGTIGALAKGMSVPMAFGNWNTTEWISPLNVQRPDQGLLRGHLRSNAGWNVDVDPTRYTLITLEGSSPSFTDLRYYNTRMEAVPLPRELYEVRGNIVILYPSGRSQLMNNLWLSFGSGTTFYSVRYGDTRSEVLPPEGAHLSLDLAGRGGIGDGGSWSNDVLSEWRAENRADSFTGVFTVRNTGQSALALRSVSVHVGATGTAADPAVYTMAEPRTIIPGGTSTLRLPIAMQGPGYAQQWVVTGETADGRRITLSDPGRFLEPRAEQWTDRTAVHQAMLQNSVTAEQWKLESDQVEFNNKLIAEYERDGHLSAATMTAFRNLPQISAAQQREMILATAGKLAAQELEALFKLEGSDGIEATRRLDLTFKLMAANPMAFGDRIGLHVMNGTPEEFAKLVKGVAEWAAGERGKYADTANTRESLAFEGVLVALLESTDGQEVLSQSTMKLVGQIGSRNFQRAELMALSESRKNLSSMSDTDIAKSIEPWGLMQINLPDNLADRFPHGGQIRTTILGLAHILWNEQNPAKRALAAVQAERIIGINANELLTIPHRDKAFSRLFSNYVSAKGFAFILDTALPTHLGSADTGIMAASLSTTSPNGMRVHIGWGMLPQSTDQMAMKTLNVGIYLVDTITGKSTAIEENIRGRSFATIDLSQYVHEFPLPKFQLKVVQFYEAMELNAKGESVHKRSYAITNPFEIYPKSPLGGAIAVKQATAAVARTYVTDFDSLDESDRNKILESLSFTGLSSRPKARAAIESILGRFLGDNGTDEHKAVWNATENRWVGTKYDSWKVGQCKYWLQEIALKSEMISIQIGNNAAGNSYYWHETADVEMVAQGAAENDVGKLGEKLKELFINGNLLSGDMVQYQAADYPHSLMIGSITQEGVWVIDSNFGPSSNDLTPRYHFRSWEAMKDANAFTVYRIKE